MKLIALSLISSLALASNSFACDQKNNKHHHGPPAAALEACGSQALESNCQFVNPNGETISGVCLNAHNPGTVCVPADKVDRFKQRFGQS